MSEKSLGFIGGGRITYIFLDGFKKANLSLQNISVSDINPETLKKLERQFSEISLTSDNTEPASKDVVLLAVHPPIVMEVLEQIKNSLRPNAILISLAPKITISDIVEKTNGFRKVARMIPNACSIVNEGFNPISFSEAIGESEKSEVSKLFSVLGDCPEVDENTLEGYAILTAMGPTYFWFQFEKLRQIALSFNLKEKQVNEGIRKMIIGAIKTFLDSGLSYEYIVDLIPGKPIFEDEKTITEIYQNRLKKIYDKIKPAKK